MELRSRLRSRSTVDSSSRSTADSDSESSDSDSVSSLSSSTQSSSSESDSNPLSVDTSLRECKRRDKILRDYIRKRDWDQSLEFKLARNLLISPTRTWRRHYSRYHYLFDYEWVNPAGKGDLVFTDGNNRFLIVELKSMLTDIGLTSGKRSRERRRRKMRHVEEQTRTYAKQWHEMNPQVDSTVGVCITETESKQLIELER